MFGIIRPCAHRLGEDLRRVWMSHLCGLCLTLRDMHGQAARVATNVDGVVLSVLVAAQTDGGAAIRRAGPCPLRGMRRAEVVASTAAGARLSAGVSLAAVATKAVDHVADADGPLARPLFAAATRSLAGRAAAAAARTAAGVGFDTAVLTRAAGHQLELELSCRAGTDLLALTAPTEQAAASTFEHTAFLAGRSHNAPPLAAAGRLFGRLTHLLDAVADQVEDDARGAYNPLTATGSDLGRARAVCGDAVNGLRAALAETVLTDGPDARLLHALLAHEVGHSVERAFRSAAATSVACASQPGMQHNNSTLTIPYSLAAAGVSFTQTGVGHAMPACWTGKNMEDNQTHRSSRRSDCLDCCDCCDCLDCCDCCDCTC
jgi:hypothetical protein